MGNPLTIQWGDKVVMLEPAFSQWLLNNMQQLRVQYESDVVRIAKVHQTVSATDPNRPPFEKFKDAICRGTYALGNHCGNCEKCSWEREHYYFAKLSEKYPPSPFTAAPESAGISPQPFAGVKSDDRTTQHH